MDPSQKNAFGRTAIQVTAMGYGTAPIGNIFRPISEQESENMIRQAWDNGLRYFDTAPLYGHGLSEARVGHGLRWYPRDEYVLSTKVGRLLKPKKRSEIDSGVWVNPLPFEAVFDYSYSATMRSIEDSLQRMALEHIDIAFIHDCDFYTHGDQQPHYFRQAMDGAWRALAQLRDEGVIKAVGMGVNEWQVCHAALQEADFDCFLLAGRYTLLEQEALKAFLPLCEERNAAVVIGGGFNSGILATGAVENAKYNYGPASQAILQKVSKIENVCRDYHVSLPAAALQFVLAHPAVPTIIPGTRTVAQLENCLEWIAAPIPDDFWRTLQQQGLLDEAAPTPADRLI
ncbi:aldo/keto reductase [Raoultella planticola]|uniref:aldo/keto reductase n=1 Tax=Raoultella planticola TaxID=575 RepID=UPI00045B6211|nr:aldo/keto reductase [Raoultella planticola]KAJ96678.1 pyridoxal 4-dehydrogenase [Raoultella planticola]